MRKVTYFGAKLRRVVNRSAPGQAKGHGTRLLPDRGGQRQSAGDRREWVREALHTLNNFWLIAFRPRPQLRHQKAAKWSRRRSVKCGQAKSATRRPTTDDQQPTTTTTTTTALTMQLAWPWPKWKTYLIYFAFCHSQPFNSIKRREFLLRASFKRRA